ncbi:RIF1 [[Candida] subhashii]|uniref:RIF1 n=1 Tax=[Candida] subhashii TaxID=561895 RepID=A0A8J5Q370_9ASCO|nr:RIF1 [[Candida] subhashii]KAG7661079.1 RIF1 [[Candida] subhashii]
MAPSIASDKRRTRQTTVNSINDGSPIRKSKATHKKHRSSLSPKHVSTPIKIPIINCQPRSLSPQELNSSPIKKVNSSPTKKVSQSSSNNSSPIRRNFLSSSPIKKKKSVAFSDDLVSDLPSTPDRNFTPRSILKAYNFNLNHSVVDPNNTALWEKSVNGPKNPNFWLQGTIIQLPANSPDLHHLIEGCIHVLQDDSFNRRFEVYATLNSICKSNTNEALVKLFTISPNPVNPTPPNKSSPSQNQHKSEPIQNLIMCLSAQIRRDIEITEQQLFSSELDKENKSPSKNDPFRIRVISQALKLMNILLMDQELNNFLPFDDIEWFYRHACDILVHPRVSKALVSPYLLIIKDCKLSPKRKRLLFDNGEIPERMLASLVNMKGFPSSSLVTEKFVCFKNFVLNFPNIMAKNMAHWFGLLILNICDINSPFYYKCFSVGVNCLLEVAKAFLDNKMVSLYVRDFLASGIPANIRSIASGTPLEIDSESPQSQKVKSIDIITYKLEELISAGQYKFAMDIWVALTLLVGDSGSGFDKWEHLNQWLQIPKFCFNSQDVQARILALSCWKAVSYNLCRNDLVEIRKVLDPIMRSSNVKDRSQLINNAVKTKMRLLTYLFGSFNAAEVQNEVVDTLHNLFCSIIYCIVNPQVMKSSTKYLHVYWDKMIQLVFMNFYFKKDGSTEYMHQLGLKVLTRFLKLSTPINERNFNEIRCLSNESVSLNEINSLPPRWIHSKFDRIMQSIILVFQSDQLYIEQKVDLLIAFLGSIRPVTKMEPKVSATTFDIIDNIPVVLDILLSSGSPLSYDMIHKIILNLHDTFDPSLFVHRRNDMEDIDTDSNIYFPLMQSCMPRCSSEETLELLNLIVSSLSEDKVLVFIADFCKLELSDSAKHLFSEVLNKRSVGVSKFELNLYGEICEHFDIGFDVFVKRLIQRIVSIPDSEEQRRCLTYLNIEKWCMETKMYFLLLVKGAPNTHVQSFTTDLLLRCFEGQVNFVAMFQFLADQGLDDEIFNVSGEIIDKIRTLDNELQLEALQILRRYLTIKSNEENKNFKLLDRLLSLCCIELNINIEEFLIFETSQLTVLESELNERGLCIGNGKIVPATSFSNSSSTSQQTVETQLDQESTEVVKIKQENEDIIVPDSLEGGIESVVSSEERRTSNVADVSVLQVADSLREQILESNTLGETIETDSASGSLDFASKKSDAVVQESSSDNKSVASIRKKKRSSSRKGKKKSSKVKKEKETGMSIISEETIQDTEENASLSTNQQQDSCSITEVMERASGRLLRSSARVSSSDISMEENDDVSEVEGDSMLESIMNESDEIDDSSPFELELVSNESEKSTANVENSLKRKSTEEDTEPSKRAKVDSHIVHDQDILPDTNNDSDDHEKTETTEVEASTTDDPPDTKSVESQNFEAHSTKISEACEVDSGKSTVEDKRASESRLAAIEEFDEKIDSNSQTSQTSSLEESPESLNFKGQSTLVDENLDLVIDTPNDIQQICDTPMETIEEEESKEPQELSLERLHAGLPEVVESSDENMRSCLVTTDIATTSQVVENTDEPESMEIVRIQDPSAQIVSQRELNIGQLVGSLESATDEELMKLTPEEKYNIETSLLNLMLRLRSAR